MKLNYPYEKSSVRKARLWKAAGESVNIHPVILREYYLDEYLGCTASDFISLIKKGKIKIDPKDLKTFTPEEILDRESKSQKAAEDNDFCDLLTWRLKNLIEIGDYLVSDENKTFLSGGKYQTKGKKYKITDLKDEGGSNFGYVTTADIKGEKIWGSNYGVKSVWRKGKEIWNWNLAYLELWLEENPNHPETEKMIKHCNEGAEKTRKGKR